MSTPQRPSGPGAARPSPISRPGRTLTLAPDQKRERLQQIFHNFDSLGRGSISQNGIEAMVKLMMKPKDKSERENSRGIATVILQSLDKDKSGTVEEAEFIAWFEKGSQMSPDQRKNFAASGKVQCAILAFLEAVEQSMLSVTQDTGDNREGGRPVKNIENDQGAKNPHEKYANECVADLFDQFDTSSTGHIDTDQLCAMLMEVSLSSGKNSSYDATYDAASQVLKILDTDASGTLEPGELATWVVEGMKLTPDARRSFAKSAPAKAALIRFLSSVEDMVHEKMMGDGVLLESDMNNGVDLEVLNSVKQIFKKYDADGSGAIDKSELATMIQQLNSTSASFAEYNDPAVLADATAFVMSALSPNLKPDEEPLLTVHSFSAWVQEGMKLTPIERKKFARQGRERAVLVRLLRSVEEMMETLKQEALSNFKESANPEAARALSLKEIVTYDGQLQRAITDIFTQYDTDGSGAIDVQELAAMITEVQVEEGVNSELIDHKQSQEAAISVMKVLLKGTISTNGSEDPETACLDLPKFEGWLSKGLKMTGQQRKAFAAVKPENAVLARFLRAVERLARQYTQDTPLSRAVRSVFIKYDVDGSGLIDEDELKSIIVDLISAEGGDIAESAARNAATQMMKMLTSSAGENEKIRLSEQAFLGWVHKGTKMTGAKRRSFAKQSDARRAMVLLLRTIEVQARQEVWTPEKKILHKLFQKYDGKTLLSCMCCSVFYNLLFRYI